MVIYCVHEAGNGHKDKLYLWVSRSIYSIQILFPLLSFTFHRLVW